MKFTRFAIPFIVLISSLLAMPSVEAKLVPSPDGKTVYDTVLHVNWLANANLAGTPEGGLFGVANITPGGSMDYKTALNWVDALNGLNGVAPLLGHSDWTLPTSPTFPASDMTCAATGPAPNFNSFGFGCMNSDMGSLFNSTFSLGLKHPNTAVPIPDNTVGPFRNFQPYLYWTDTIDEENPKAGFHTFSLNTGWAGANVDGHYMYALPMINGNPFGTKVSGTGLQPSADGKTVYDPVTDITWLADADLAKNRKFGARCLPDGTECINSDGSMTHKEALNWIAGMKAHDHGAGYLHQTGWQLPADPGTAPCGGFGCTDTPLGELYYDQLGKPQGTPVVSTPEINVGPFNHVQPYLYWSCGEVDDPHACQVPAAPGFEWSFSFGNGFQGTDVVGNDLYVMVYYPVTDITPPVTTASVAGPLGLNGWYVGPTTVNFTATDDLSGVDKTEFSFDNGTTWSSGASASLSASAIYNILYRSTDGQGNVETPKSITVKLDSTTAAISVSANPADIVSNTRFVEVTISGSIRDNLSGVDPSTAKFVVHDEYGKNQPTGPVTLRANGNYSFTVSLNTFVRQQDGNGRLYTVKVIAENNAGDVGSAETKVVASHFKPPPPPPCKLGKKCV